MTEPELLVVFLDDHLDRGGSTMFLAKLLPALRGHAIHSTVVASDHRCEMGGLLDRLEIPRRSYPFGSEACLYDDRLADAYAALSGIRPRAVIASHETISFDLLRYVPPGVFRAGFIHTDDEWSYHLVAFYAPHLDTVVCPSRAIAEKARARLGVGGPKVEVIPYGVSIPEETRRPLPMGESLLRLLYVGRLDETQKRVRRFVPLWRELCRRPRPVRWTIVGEGPEVGYLMANLSPDGQHQVEFARGFDHDRLRDVYPRHDVLLLLSDYEGLPLTLLEGMSYGLVPVVTEQPSGIPELVDAACGRVVPPDAPEQTADVLDRLQPGTESFEQMSAAARSRIVRGYSLEAMAKGWVRLLRERTPAGEPEWPENVRFLGPPERPVRVPPWYFAAPLRPLRRWAHRVARSFRQES